MYIQDSSLLEELPLLLLLPLQLPFQLLLRCAGVASAVPLHVVVQSVLAWGPSAAAGRTGAGREVKQICFRLGTPPPPPAW